MWGRALAGEEVMETLWGVPKGIPVVLVGILHAGGHPHAPELAGVGEQVRPHPHRRELLHASLFAALVLEPDLRDSVNMG